MRPARVSDVSGGAITSRRSKPSARNQKSVTAIECPWLPMSEATTVWSPSQWRAWASASCGASMAPSTITRWMAAMVRPGKPANQPAGVASKPSRSGLLAPNPTPSGSGCTME